MGKLAVVIVLAAFFLTGCTDWMDGSYVSVTPHVDQEETVSSEMIGVSTYNELEQAVENLVSKGIEDGLICLDGFEEEDAEESLNRVVRHIKVFYPIGAFAVETIEYDLGISGDLPAVAIHIQYNRNLSQLRTLKRAKGMDEAMVVLQNAADNYASSAIVLVEAYSSLDFSQALQDYADASPDRIMEVPQITVNTYPKNGANCVLEVFFNYQTNRDSLRSMRERVEDVFSSARLYVSGDGEAEEKYTQLYAFLTERFDYQYDTSITPSYSLICHGVGDSRAFAVVYAAMCHSAGLECSVVSGTRNGDPWFWNMVCSDGLYRHVDLIHSSEFTMLADDEMSGYVWDYSAYPECIAEPLYVYTEPDESAPSFAEEEVPTEPESVPQETAEPEPTLETEPTEEVNKAT